MSGFKHWLENDRKVFAPINPSRGEAHSEATKAGLAARKARGGHLGRPIGAKSTLKLAARKERVQELMDSGASLRAIGRELGVHVQTVINFAKGEKMERRTK